jgi:hypothetical protein
VAPPDGLSATATQTRPDEAEGNAFHVRIVNDGATPVTVLSVQLASGAFHAVPPTVREETFPPGATYDLPSRYGAAVCDGSALDPLRVVMSLRGAAGPVETVLPLRSDDGLLRRIHGEECRQQDLAKRLAVELVGPLEADPEEPDRLVGTLRLDRLDEGGAIELSSLRGTVLFGASLRADAGSPVLRLGPGQDRLRRLSSSTSPRAPPTRSRRARSRTRSWPSSRSCRRLPWRPR